MVRICPTLIPLHIFPLDQPLDILLDIPHIQHTPSLRLLNDLRHQLGMRNRLSALHDPDNCRLGLELPICSHALVRLLVLGFGLAGLDLVDLDAELGVREGGVGGEGVGFVDVFAFGGLGEHAVVRAGKGL